MDSNQRSGTEPAQPSETREWPEQMLKALDASLKVQFAVNNPNHAWIGPSVIEVATSAFEQVERELAECQQRVHQCTYCGESLTPLKVVAEKELLREEITRLEAEADRYRGALEFISDGDISDGDHGDIDLRMYARKALGEG